MMYDFTLNYQDIIEIIGTILVAVIVEVIISVIIKKAFSIRYDKRVKLRQHKITNTDCTFEQAVSDIKVVNSMEESGYGIQSKKL